MSDLYKMMQAAALAGDNGGGGGGGGRSNEGNLIQTEIEQGYYDQTTREAKDSTNRCRVKGMIPVEPGAWYALVWAGLHDAVMAYGNQYAEDGTFLVQIDYRGARPAPISFQANSAAAYITLMFTPSSGTLSPEDIGVPTMVKL